MRLSNGDTVASSSKALAAFSAGDRSGLRDFKNWFSDKTDSFLFEMLTLAPIPRTLRCIEIAAEDLLLNSCSFVCNLLPSFRLLVGSIIFKSPIMLVLTGSGELCPSAADIDWDPHFVNEFNSCFWLCWSVVISTVKFLEGTRRLEAHPMFVLALPGNYLVSSARPLSE